MYRKLNSRKSGYLQGCVQEFRSFSKLDKVMTDVLIKACDIINTIIQIYLSLFFWEALFIFPTGVFDFL